MFMTEEKCINLNKLQVLEKEHVVNKAQDPTLTHNVVFVNICTYYQFTVHNLNVHYLILICLSIYITNVGKTKTRGLKF